MEEQNRCEYKDIICNTGDCSICGTYFKHKQLMEEIYKKRREGKGDDKAYTTILSRK